MTRIICTALCIPLMATPSTGRAASIDDGGGSHAMARTAVFAGPRLRLKLGGRERHRTRIVMTVAPVRSTERPDGRRALGIGDGLEMGISADRQPELMIAGHRLGASEGKRGGVPTWVLITGGVAIALGIGAAVFIDKLEDASD